MNQFRGSVCLLALLALGACASLPASGDGVAVFTETGSRAVASPYGLFLAGQAAVNGGQNAAAAAYFGQAAVIDGGDAQGLLSTRAFSSALLAGDVAKAAAIAPGGPDAEPALLHLAALVRGVDALARGDARQARVILTSKEAGAPNESAAALLAPWAAAAAGDAGASISHPVIVHEPIAEFFASLDQGKLFERAHRYDEAETAFRALIAKGDPGGIASLNLGELLERRGRGADAVAIYDAAIARNHEDSSLVAARARAAAHKPPPPLASIRESAAEALIAPGSMLLIQKQPQIALAYLRLALRLDPSRDEAWSLVGDILSSTGDEAGARAAWMEPRPGSGQYVAARTKLAWSHQSAGDKDEALKIARETLARAPRAQDAAVVTADLLRADQRYDDSAKVLDDLIGAQGDHPDWRLLYMRAVDREASGHWDEAERDLQVALKQHPDEPELLNFLGYSWIDRGEKLRVAIAMVQKAVNLEPRSGAMIDSLGWGYYRLGDFAQAVENLEAAVVLEPGDPDVNNHLGDAYWRVGRKIEARFQWSRVLSLEPTAKLKIEVEAKLKSGLEGSDGSAVVADR